MGVRARSWCAPDWWVVERRLFPCLGVLGWGVTHCWVSETPRVVPVSCVVGGWGWCAWPWCCPCCGGGGGLGLVVENWIVDASIFLWLCRCVRCVCLLLGAVFCCAGFSGVVGDGVGVGGCVWCVWWQVMKGTWWMPWHQEPMKDVGACDKPWGVGNRAVIRGCPNGET